MPDLWDEAFVRALAADKRRDRDERRYTVSMFVYGFLFGIVLSAMTVAQLIGVS